MEKAIVENSGQLKVDNSEIIYGYDLGSVWVDNQDLMQQLHISHRTLSRLRAKGKLAFCKVGRKIFYSKADISKLFEESKTIRPLPEARRLNKDRT